MKIVLLLLLIVSRLGAVSISYNPAELSFAFRDEGAAYNSSTEAISLRYSFLEAGRITGGDIAMLFSPFSPSSFSADGLVIGDESASLFMLFDPAAAAGWKLSFYGFSLSAAYTARGEVSNRLFLPVADRGGAEGVHLSAGYEHEYFSAFGKLSLTNESGFDIMGRASLSYGGITFAWSEGSVVAFSEDRSSIRRKIELEIKGGGLKYSAYLAYGNTPYISGEYRFHEGRERLSLDFGGITLQSSHSASFSSAGRYRESFRFTVSWRNFTLGFDSDFLPIAEYDDGFLVAGYESGSFYYGCTLKLEYLAVFLVMDSKGSISARLNLLF